MVVTTDSESSTTLQLLVPIMRLPLHGRLMGRASVLPHLKQAPLLGSVAVRDGLLTRAQLRSSAWTQLFRDVYVWSGLELTPLVYAQAAALLLPPEGSLSGLTAALVHGIHVLRPAVEVTVSPSCGMTSRPRLQVRRAEVPAEERMEVNGLPVTTPLRTAFDVACHEPVGDAVVVVDAFLRLGLLRAGQLGSYARGLPANRRCRRRAIRACELSAVGAESAMETRNRLVIVLGGLPAPVCQYVVTDECGAFLARVDLAYPELKIAIEYDGALHRDADRYANDRWRDNLLVAAGWTVLRFTARDIYRFPERVVEQVAAAIQSAS